jgi:plasmid stability protein
MHATITIMKAVPQYTIRNMPEPVDRYLRKRAKQTGKSLNQVIIDELAEKAQAMEGGESKSLLDSLDWLLGSGMDQETLDALEEMDREQKRLGAREMAKLDELSGL